jgi:hypothetical protein
MWPKIIKTYPDATLDIFYGWNNFDALCANNPERMQWKQKMVELLKQEGITEHGRVGKKELSEYYEKCGILAYPSHFYEIFCISVVESQSHGCVPVTTNIGALSETVEYGVRVDGEINQREVQEEYLKELLSLMGDEKRWKKLSSKGRKWARQYDWGEVANAWAREFIKKDESVKLTVYTPTIRRGFWNIMADNLSKQTYKNFEWVIVDDYPRDRSDTAQEYASKYKLDIKYLRGKPRKVKRTYGLCNANNTVMENATGEVLVFLQDFILIPLDGLEQIATLYRKHPDCLQALPDAYYAPKIKPDKEKEDWFNGNTDVIGEFIRKNIRIQNLGLRFSDNPMDFEQNYGAIPIKIARELGGWHEWLDEGLGWDNTDMAWRSLQSGYKILIDETNIAVCIDHWKTLEGTPEHGLERERRLNDPRYYYIQEMVKAGKMPLKRTQEQDDKVELLYNMPKDVPKGDEVKWLKEHVDFIVDKWIKDIKL